MRIPRLRIPRRHIAVDDALLIIGPAVITCGLWTLAPAAAIVFGGLVITIYGVALARGATTNG